MICEVVPESRLEALLPLKNMLVGFVVLQEGRFDFVVGWLLEGMGLLAHAQAVVFHTTLYYGVNT